MNARNLNKLNSFAAGATFVAAAIGLLIVTATSHAADPLINGGAGPTPKATMSKGVPAGAFSRDPMQDVRDEYSFTNTKSVGKVSTPAQVASERDPRCDVRDECTSGITYREPVSSNVRVTQERSGETVVR